MERTTHVDTFNRLLRSLLKDLGRLHKEDTEVDRLNKRVGLLLSLDPLGAMRLVGPFLVAYRTQIKAARDEKNDDFFLKNDFAAELKKADEREVPARLIDLIKGDWKTLDSAKRDDYRTVVYGMLNAYLDYHDSTPARAK